MKIKEIIRNRIKEEFESYDWEETIEEALNEIDFSFIIERKISYYIQNYDLTSTIEDIVDDIIDEELYDIDLDEIIKESVGY